MRADGISLLRRFDLAISQIRAYRHGRSKGQGWGSSSPDKVTACPHCWSTLIPRHSVVTLSGRSEFFDRTRAFHRSIRESRVPLPLVPSFITYGIIIIIGGTLGCFDDFVFSSRGGLPSLRSDISRSHLHTRNFVVDVWGRARHSEGEGGQRVQKESGDGCWLLWLFHQTVSHHTQYTAHTQQTSI